jgi:TctA family transporter
MTVYLVIPLPKISYIHRIYIWFWPTLDMCVSPTLAGPAVLLFDAVFLIKGFLGAAVVPEQSNFICWSTRLDSCVSPTLAGPAVLLFDAVFLIKAFLGAAVIPEQSDQCYEDHATSVMKII